MTRVALRVRARRAYAAGRIGGAILPAVAATALGVIASRCACRLPCSLALTPLLVAAVAFLSWRSATLRRAARFGLVAGLVPFALPLMLCGTHGACEAGGCAALTFACATGGAVAGALTGLLAARQAASRRLSLVAGAAVALLTGALGCATVGAIGAVALAMGLLLTTLPALAFARPAPP